MSIMILKNTVMKTLLNITSARESYYSFVEIPFLGPFALIEKKEITTWWQVAIKLVVKSGRSDCIVCTYMGILRDRIYSILYSNYFHLWPICALRRDGRFFQMHITLEAKI